MQFDGVGEDGERRVGHERRSRAGDKILGQLDRDVGLRRQLGPVDDADLVVDRVVAGTGRVAEEDVGDSDAGEVHVVAPALAEDRTHQVGLELTADGRRHRALQARAAGFGADREARVAQTRQQVGALNVEVHIGDGLRDRHEWVLGVIRRAQEAVFLAIPQRDDDRSARAAGQVRDRVADLDGGRGARGVVGRAVADGIGRAGSRDNPSPRGRSDRRRSRTRREVRCRE